MKQVKKSYPKKLRHPLWQKKRLEILNRDGWKCACCKEDQEMLFVHHIVYHYKAKPWEYDNSELITFCDKCHKFEHALLIMASVGVRLDSAGV